MSQANVVASSKLTGETISPHVMKAEYAVRGDIVVRAGEIGKELKKGKKFPFTDLVMCNIGNPQALGQKPITFYRQVLAICDYPQVRTLQRKQAPLPHAHVTRCTILWHQQECNLTAAPLFSVGKFTYLVAYTAAGRSGVSEALSS